MSDDPPRSARPREPRAPRQEPPARGPDGRPNYNVYRTRPRLLEGLRHREPSTGPGGLRDRFKGPKRRRKPWTVGRVIKWIVLVVVGWVALSLVLFLISAQLQQEKVSDAAERALDSGGPLPFFPNTILVLGSDARTERTAEPGSRVGAPSRSDSILLLRVGGGANQRLAIPRDTVVDIPGQGENKINAAYAIGGPALTISTVKRYLGIDINHLIEVDFANFPDFINALGGIDVRTGCVISNINGGAENGGFTLRLRPGEHHLDGEQALILARTRTNECNPGEDDLTRAARQQQILSAVKDQVTSPSTFFRLPWVSWEAPQTIRSDMSGPSLLGLFGAMAFSGSPQPRVLKPSGVATLPDGGSGLTVSEEDRRQEVRRFLD